MRLRRVGRVPDLNVILPMARTDALKKRQANVRSVGSGPRRLVLGTIVALQTA